MGIASVVESPAARGVGVGGPRVPHGRRQHGPTATEEGARWAKEKPIVSGFAAHDFASQSFSQVITVDFQHK